jgi:biofilm PGA synthesis N-glycosyltransferase PgaC
MSPESVFYVLAGMFVWSTYGYYFFLKIITSGRSLKECSKTDDFSIVLVLHNAGEKIKAKYEELASYQSDKLKKIIIMDDGSDDGSLDFFKDLDNSKFILISHERAGKSAALNHARTLVETPVAVLIDLRQSICEEDLLQLVSRVSGEGPAGASGSLSLPGGDQSYWNMEKNLRYYEGLLSKTVGLSGSGCAIQTKYWKEIPNNTLADDMALGLSLLAQGQKVCLDPNVKIIEPLVPDMKVEMPRKVRTLSANWQIFTQPFKYDLPLNPVSVFFVISHKFLRLLFPFMLIGMVVCVLKTDCDIMQYSMYTMIALSALSFLPIKILKPLKQLIYLNVAASIAFFTWPSHASKGQW